ncbi:50S ribosomal protein L4, partial [Patescibacteria group bacterium]|nr:50S ribosomal protein L4 [Patescibacteria group bacterium]
KSLDKIVFKVPVYNLEAKKAGTLGLNRSVFGAKPNPRLLAQSIKVYLSNQRKAKAKTKNRSEVRGSTKKIWAQKGTGRARHGDRRAPIFVGGGIAHGPRGEQNYKLKLTKKMRKLALKIILSIFATNKRILSVEKLDKITPKTKKALSLIAGLKDKNKVLSKSKNLGIIISDSSQNIKRAFRNLTCVSILSTKSLNTYQLSKQNFLIFTKKALEELNKT